MFKVGLNPYGLTYTLGLQGLGTPRANPQGLGLPGFLRIAESLGARCIELDWRWLTPLSPDMLTELSQTCARGGVAIIVSAWLQHLPGETLEDAIRVSAALKASLLRLHLSPVLEGARARLGDRWLAMITHIRTTLRTEAARARDRDVPLGLENHQDFGSEELLAFADEAGPHVGLVLDTGNPFAVGEDPLAFVRRTAARIRHVHLKDYRAQFTEEGVRLVRCAIGDGCVPLQAIERALAPHHTSLTASLEPAALEARHIRLFTADWWHGYAPRDAAELGDALGRLQYRRLTDAEDYRTPWERRASADAILAYEQGHLQRSVARMQAWGWLAPTLP